MSNAYRIHGARFLRKYSAADRSSIYSYMADVRTIANTLCKVPWTRVKADIPATTTIHTEEGLDWNEPERDRFDAAEWCGEHSDGFHRAFAQAACYVFKLPTSAIGTAIEKLRIQVTGDAYNPYGARISAMTSATLDIPMDCATVREGEVFRAPDEGGMGAAPRLFLRNKDGSQQWYSNTELVELTPETPLTAKQYLFVFVCLENYNRGRDGWIEGSSYIDNDVELTLGTACADLDADELNDLSQVVQPVETPVVRGGVVPDVAPDDTGVYVLGATAAGSIPLLDENRHPVDEALDDETSPENVHQGVMSAFGQLVSGDMKKTDVLSSAPNRARKGAGFCVKSTDGISIYYENGRSVSPRMIVLTASSLVIPFSIPSEGASKIRFDWAAWADANTPDEKAVFNFWIKYGDYVKNYPGDTLRKREIYDASKDEVDGWLLLGTASAASGTTGPIEISAAPGSVASVLVTAYIPQEGVSRQNANTFSGTGDIWFNDLTDDSHVPISAEVYPAFSSLVDYSVGDKVSTKYYTDAVTPYNIMKAGEDLYIGYSEGTLYRSENHIDWTEVLTVDGGSVVDVFAAGGKIYAFFEKTNHLETYRSEDGQTWEQVGDVSFAVYYPTYIRKFGYVGANLVLVGNDGRYGSHGMIFTSSDYGASWNNVNISLDSDTFADIIGSKLFILSDGVLKVSSDGSSFSTSTGSSLPTAFLNGKYVRNQNGVAQYSSTGISWTNAGLPEGSGKAVVAGDFAYYFCDAGVYKSNDCVLWEKVGDWGPDFSESNAAEIIWSGRVWYVHDYMKIYVTHDFKSWSVLHQIHDEDDGSIFIRVNQYGCAIIVEIMGSNRSFYTFDGAHLVEIEKIYSRVSSGYDNWFFISDYPGGKIFTCGEFAWRCEQNVAHGSPFDRSKWSRIYDVVRTRMNGASALMIPDVTLIG